MFLPGYSLESLMVLGRLKPAWIRNGRRLHQNYNWRVATFRSRIIEMIARKAPLYGLSTSFVNPRGTTRSKENMILQKKLRIDRHTASAVLIAMICLDIKSL